MQLCVSSLRRTDSVRELLVRLQWTCAGRLASLSVFDSALGLDGVQQLYQQGIAGVTDVSAVGALLMPPHLSG